MILTAIYNMLSTGEVWNPVDLAKIDMPPELKEKHKQNSLKKAAKLLITNGVIAPSDLKFSLDAT